MPILLLLMASTLLSSCLHRTLLNDLHGSMKDLPAAVNEIHKTVSALHEDVLTDISSKLPLPDLTQIWFVRPDRNGMKIIAVNRKIAADNKIEAAVRELLNGPSPDEIAEGLASEIPRGTVLLGVEQKNGRIELNLSRRFASGGGIDSIETRLEQLSKTVMAVAQQQDVFLNIEWQRLTMTPGEGVEIRQPINR